MARTKSVRVSKSRKQIGATALKHPAKPSPVSKPRKKRRFKPGTVALRDVIRLQKNGKNLVPRAAMARIIRNALTENMRLSAKAIDAAHSYLEASIVKHAEDAGLCALHANRKTVVPSDSSLAFRLYHGATIGTMVSVLKVST